MNDTVKKWGSFIAFLILAAISCWATEHSFHLLIPSTTLPRVAVWGLTIGFFVLASFGTKWALDALKPDIYTQHYYRNLWGGIATVVVFWLFMSMPTNTHTFFYNHSIDGTLQEDFTTTDGYLAQIEGRVNTDTNYYAFRDEADALFKKISQEFNGLGRTGERGNGEHVRDAIENLNTHLAKQSESAKVTFLPQYMYSKDNAILTEYERQKDAALELIRETNYKATPSAASDASTLRQRIAIMRDTVDKMSDAGNIHEDIVTQSESQLKSAYACVKDNARFVKFKTAKDEERYTKENLETRTKRLLSVWDVWVDFLHGKYPMTFIFYVLLSILVDVGAFLFFNMTFKEDKI